MSVKEVLACAVAAFALYVAAGSAYILGVLLGLPAVVVTSLNHTSITHLFGQATFGAVLAFTFFKLSKVIVNGVLIFTNFLLCKYYYGGRRPRGLDDPTVARLQRRMDSAVIEGRAYGKSAIIARASITIVFMYLMFFQIDLTQTITTLARALGYALIWLLGSMFVFSSMLAYRVLDGRTCREFLSSPEGRGFGVLLALWIIFLIGTVRSSSMMHGPTFHYSPEEKVCRLAPMMPVYGGDLYFDQQSNNFVIINDGKILLHVPHLTSEAPSCV
ncbi:hypothetical protein RM543_07930 [Roseicyclus sp. F158]|uniref:Uncharacterized protein n=1 Tax=Tropicimonas omnivorans TaxID=3075590 RepID=A0ABU3DFX0_9RHOB|nr:hypothetical protein [Roseicyclus sp. F158]MDT0682610.1 hypothetical protein [Roseicyclus sp. F158]